MKLFFISSRKLKVTLTAEECAHHGIRVTDGEYEGAGVRALLAEVLCLAEREVGFRIEGERSLVQLYPTEDGNAEMFVTRLTEPDLTRLGKDSARLALTAENEEGRCYYPLTRAEISTLIASGALDGCIMNLYKKSDGAYLLRLIHGYSVNGTVEAHLCEYCRRIRLPYAVVTEYFREVGRGLTPVQVGELIED